jgi:hypothetical protein
MSSSVPDDRNGPLGRDASESEDDRTRWIVPLALILIGITLLV